MKLLRIEQPKWLARLLFSIYLLNCSDLFFTYTYLKLGGFYEANPFMSFLLINPYLLISAKLILPGLLIGYLISKVDEIVHDAYLFYIYCLCIVFIFYILVNLIHLYYLFFYI